MASDDVEVTVPLSLDLELSLFSRSRVRSLDSLCPAAFSTDFLRRNLAPWATAAAAAATEGSSFSSPELASPLGPGDTLALGMVWRRGSSEERSLASDFLPWYAVSIRVSVVVTEVEDFLS